MSPNFISIADYLAGEEISGVKHEYLGGTVHAMAGASNQHNTIALNCLGALLNQLRGKSCRPFNSDTKVRIEFPDQRRFVLQRMAAESATAHVIEDALH